MGEMKEKTILQISLMKCQEGKEILLLNILLILENNQYDVFNNTINITETNRAGKCEYDPQHSLAGSWLMCIIKKNILWVLNHALPPVLRKAVPPSHYFTEHTNFKVYVYKHFVVFLMLLAF